MGINSLVSYAMVSELRMGNSRQIVNDRREFRITRADENSAMLDIALCILTRSYTRKVSTRRGYTSFQRSIVYALAFRGRSYLPIRGAVSKVPE